jgi:hypothetical protein
MRCLGLTSKEWLVVVSIVVVLSALIGLPIIGSHRPNPRVKTQAVLMQIDAACLQYHMVFGVFPDDGLQAIFMHGATPVPVDRITPAQWDVVGERLMIMLQQIDRDDFTVVRYPQGRITDSWGNTIRYRPALYYPYQEGAPTVLDSVRPPHRDSYQLWSIGSDGVDKFGADDSDDVVDWR